MKKSILLLLLLTTTLFAQDYDKNWIKVVQLENEGKIKSAASEVKKIHKKAKNDANEIQLIKCFFYQSKYIQALDENAQSEIIGNLESEITTGSIPTKAIFNLIYANCLTSYLNNNNYIIYNRTQLENTQLGSFLTWTSADFHKTIEASYEKTLENEAILRATSLKKYEAIFDYLSKKSFENSTLFEFLAKETIAYHQTKLYENNSYPYDNNLNLFCSNDQFAELNFDSVENPNLKKILLLFQKINATSNSPEHEFDRLVFCDKFLVKNTTEFITTLNALQKRTTDKWLLQKIMYEKAIRFLKLSSKETYPDYNTKALALFDSIIAVTTKSNCYFNSLNQKQRLTAKYLNITLQKYGYEKEKIRAQVSYKNVDSFSLKIYKITTKQESLNFSKDSIYTDFISKNKSFKTLHYSLINKKDYFNYTTEILLPELELGTYLLFASDSESSKKFRVYRTITVSNSSVLAHIINGQEVYQVLHRKTGKPIENCLVKIDTIQSRTDANGFVKFVERTDRNNRWYSYNKDLTLITANDTLQLATNYLTNLSKEKNKDENNRTKVVFYLDRAIYRPGQTVYYKGIAVKESNTTKEIIANLSLQIVLENATNEILKTIAVKTNEFGSFSGEFLLPKNGLTGNYFIYAEEPEVPKEDNSFQFVNSNDFWKTNTLENSTVLFKVEEYKRPKFEVHFEPNKKIYLLHQEVKIKGAAKGFSGNTIADAKVTYTVIRRVSNDFFRGNSVNYNEKTLISSETVTDKNGAFEVNFKAIPDETELTDRPISFTYTITADVTDNNGETHTATTSIRVGNRSLLLNLIVPNKISSAEKNKVQLKCTNLNYEKVAASGEVQLFFIREFSNKFKNRIFSFPEIEGISNENFEQLFPYENNEKPFTKNDKGTLVYSKKINTAETNELPLDFISNYKSGYYRIVFKAKDEFNLEQETERRFEIIQPNDKKAIGNNLIICKQLNENPKKDGFIHIQIRAAIPELYLSVAGIDNNSLFFEKNIFVENFTTELKIPITKKINNKLTVAFETVFENQYFKYETEVYIKEEKLVTTIETESFRNKIEPGSKESWSFKIKNSSNSAMEVLAAMYDSSLDQFAIKKWGNLTSDNYIEDYNGKTALGFEKVYFSLSDNFRWQNQYSASENEKIHLFWFGFDFTNSNNSYSNEIYKKFISKKAKKPLNASLISGKISCIYGPLSNVTIGVKGTLRSVKTDSDGTFEIEVALGEKLVVSCIGFENQEIKIKTFDQINSTLTMKNGTELEEVVVTGYGVKRKEKSLSYAVQTIKGDSDLEDNTIVSALSGKVAGVQVTTAVGSGDSDSKIILRGNTSLTDKGIKLFIIDGIVYETKDKEETNLPVEITSLNPDDILSINVLKGTEASALYGLKAKDGVVIITTKKGIQQLTQVKTRTNLSETAFFFPHLEPDEKGKLTVNFTSPEALTQWKFRLLAHNKKATTGYLEKTVVTQKELMLLPNFPRFLRENDTINISAKVVNMTADAKTGVAILQLFDATTMEPIDVKMENKNAIKNFSLKAASDTSIQWKLIIPKGVQGIQYKVIAKAGNHTDGEEAIMPVLTNTLLVTESIPIWVREHSKKEFTFDELKITNSSTLRNQQFTLEYTSNPTWMAIQSLPYLMEFQHECAEQTFARFYANAIATELINSNPKIASVFTSWKNSNKLVSKLQQNEELKSLILAETPWVNDAISETEKKNKLALLFDLEQMKSSLDDALTKLIKKQNPNGGFSWFPGGPDNSYITQHIISGFGHLKKMNNPWVTNEKVTKVIDKGIQFMDEQFLEMHKTRLVNEIKYSKWNWDDNYIDLHYFYGRSFYLKNNPLPEAISVASNRYIETIESNWLNYSIYKKGLAALILNRFNRRESALKILNNLKETASTTEEWGMYWLENSAGYYWYSAPIETQALLIEAFSEIENDTKSVNAMKVWLVKNKQTKNWPTTKSTTEAIYALVMQGADWLSIKENTVLKIGDKKIITKKIDEKEMETGYLKRSWDSTEINKEMATISVENKSDVPGFGGAYWSYFEELDKIKSFEGSKLSTSKELFLKKNTGNGLELQKITPNTKLKIGDLVTVRVLITAKEPMEFVHLKDMRAACFEPINVLSDYYWQDGLGFYRSTKDAATHFFFDAIDKGTYVLEYDVRVTNSGYFSNGITTIESMYAPEFTSHTKGMRVSVKE